MLLEVCGPNGEAIKTFICSVTLLSVEEGEGGIGECDVPLTLRGDGENSLILVYYLYCTKALSQLPSVRIKPKHSLACLTLIHYQPSCLTEERERDCHSTEMPSISFLPTYSPFYSHSHGVQAFPASLATV